MALRHILYNRINKIYPLMALLSPLRGFGGRKVKNKSITLTISNYLRIIEFIFFLHTNRAILWLLQCNADSFCRSNGGQPVVLLR